LRLAPRPKRRVKMVRLSGMVLAAGLLAAQSVCATGQRYRETTLHERCTRDRCVYNDRHGNRVGAVERLAPNRLRITDTRGNTLAKVSKSNGTVNVESPYGRR
jgi:hypothetical protein